MGLCNMSRVAVTVSEADIKVDFRTHRLISSYGGALAVPNKCFLYLQIDKRVNICRGSEGEWLSWCSLTWGSDHNGNKSNNLQCTLPWLESWVLGLPKPLNFANLQSVTTFDHKITLHESDFHECFPNCLYNLVMPVVYVWWYWNSLFLIQ
jgi:hypothetical protein